MTAKTAIQSLSSFLFGIVIGAGIALILTPWEGSELREKLGISKEDVEKKVRRVKRKIRKLEEGLEVSPT